MAIHSIIIIMREILAAQSLYNILTNSVQTVPKDQ